MKLGTCYKIVPSPDGLRIAVVRGSKLDVRDVSTGEVLWSQGQKDEARRVWRESKGRDAANDVLKETLARLRVDL